MYLLIEARHILSTKIKKGKNKLVITKEKYI